MNEAQLHRFRGDRSATGARMTKRRRNGTSAAASRPRKPVRQARKPRAPAAKMQSAALLARELQEVRRQQAATADVLKVISRSTFDLQAVLDTLVESAARLCDADMANIWRPHDEGYRLAASYAVTSKSKAALANKEYLQSIIIKPGQGSIVGRTLLEGRTVHVHDVQADPEYDLGGVKALGDYRTTLGVPLLRQGSPIGVLFLTRTRVEPFTQQQVDLVATFADQAVIAIENVRLFEAEQQRTRELSEALEQQTATSEVLQVISSSPGELEPVFQAMLSNATQICGAEFGVLHMAEGDAFRTVALHNAPLAYAESKRRDPTVRYLPKGSALARVSATLAPVQIADVLAEAAYTDASVSENTSRLAFAGLTGVRSLVAVPMVKEGVLLGV